MKYKNTGATHRLLDGTEVKRGKVFESDDKDLMKKFPNKFERAVDDAVVNPKTNTPAPKKIKDVTADFPTAEEAQVTVAKIGNGFWVTEEGEEEPSHENALKKGQVAKFIEELEEDEDEE